jgi:geranylgeranyl reductase family protein
MKQTDQFNTIIVGGGPAGATAAYLLGKQGINVLLIDKDEFPRPKLCGGLLTFKTVKLLNRIFGDTIDSLQEKGVINYISYSYELRTRNEILQSGTTDIPAILVDRSVYDAYLLNRAIAAGAQVLSGERVVSLDLDDLKITTETGKIFKSKIVIGADGANSIVRRAIQDSNNAISRWRKNLATGLEVVIPRNSSVHKVSGPIIFLDIVPWGYGWVFPNQHNLVVGVGCLNPRRVNLNNSLNKLLDSIQYGGSALRPLGHPIPYGNFLKSPIKKSVLLIGDAAGFVDPLMGEGIYYAHRSAEIAAICICDSRQSFLSEELEKKFVKSIRREIIAELSVIKKFRWLIFSSLDFFGTVALKFIIFLVGIRKFTELVHGIRSYTWKRG